jgi:hypothetical protein
MKASFVYRAYVVSHDGSAFIAVSADGEPFQLRSKNMLRVTRAIDTLWNALEGKVQMPAWLSLPDEIIDVDAASTETMLVVDQPAAATSCPIAPVLAPIQAAA